MKKVSSKPEFSSATLRAFRSALLRWYDANGRDLPWRKTRDPYRIWVSEIMLQQTRVAAVFEHYRLFLERFPSLPALAAASESSVLAAWSGLGYYRRARMLHQCAQGVVADHGGCLPQDSGSLLALPGIGRYTAAAVASIAFGEPVAVVDGNVERVLQRMTGAKLTSAATWTYAEKFLSRDRPGDFNQAMMELGATVCTPRRPGCEACPVRSWCATQGEQVPGKTGPSRQAKKEIWYTLARRNGHVRLVQRSVHDSLMGGMWELPQSAQGGPDPSHTSGIAAKRRKTTAHGASRGSELRGRRAPAGRKKGHDALWRTFRHSITVTDYLVHVMPASMPAPKGKWIAIESIPDIPITGLTRKILKASGII